MMRRGLLAIGIGCLLTTLLAGPGAAEDWPAYKHDAGRSGVTTETLDFPLAQTWSRRPNQPPAPAWVQPGRELHRMDFDYAPEPVMAGGLVYLASSSDDTVRAFRADSGELVWRFITGGPLRFSPTIAGGRAYVACDDGYIYCLDAATGALVWRFHAAPGDDQLLGNDRMISRWPSRSGPIVVDDIVYCTGGMWPTAGVYIYALDAATGEEIWCNDSSGELYLDLPHPGASGFSGVAPQGYLLVRDDMLLVATGRCVPAAFDRHTGRLLYYKPADALYHGSSRVTSVEDLYFNSRNHMTNPSQAYTGDRDPRSGDGMFAYSSASGDVLFALNGKYRVLGNAGVVYAVGNGNLAAFDLAVLRETRKVTGAASKWSIPYTTRVYCMAMAGGTLLLGCDGRITALDSVDGSVVWEKEIAGQVRGLAVSDGRLIATLGTGEMICFGAGAEGDAPPALLTAATPTPASADLERTISGIVAQSGKTEGYALVIGEPDARLAEALAARTELHVVAVLPNADGVQTERERLLATGLYGERVWVASIDDPTDLPFAPYFADLVVMSGDAGGASPAECYRVLRPCGGALCFAGLDAAARAEFIAAAGVLDGEPSGDGSMIVRGDLPGAGTWRYPWADGGRTGVSAEKRVRLPLEMLWFGGPGPDRMMDRHLMTSPPVSAHGRVFVTGQDDVIAFDAYNGRELWSRPLPGVGRKYAQYYSSGLVADETGVCAVQGAQCHRFDQATGETLAVYDIPASVISGTPPPVVQQYVGVQWPESWRVIGPFPKGTEAIAPEALGTIPESVTVDGQERVAVEVAAADGVVDFTNLYGGWGLQPLAEGQVPAASPRRGSKFDLQQAGQVAYAFATIDCPEDGKLLVGAGADWWMQWFLDGQPIFDTLKGGNEPSRHDYRGREACSETDYLFDVDVTAGKHVLAVIVKSGSRGWSLASASMGDRVAEIMPIVTGDANLPELGSMVWGYVSAVDDMVLGSYNVPIVAGQPGEDHLVWRSESKAVFALNRDDGSLRWVYRAGADRTVSNIEIAFGDGQIFLIDATSKADTIRARRRGEDLDVKMSLVALDLADGTEVWRQDDVPVLGDRSIETRIKSNPSHLFMGLPNWSHLVYSDGVVLLGANAAYDAATGDKLWQATTRPRKLPIVHGEWLITQPFAFNLRTGQQRMSEDRLTGEEIPWRFGRAYGCGPINGCENLLFFRSGADGFFDMNVEGTTNFGGIRPNCARSLIAAHGLLIHPEGYSGCACSYNYQTSMALVPAEEGNGTWYVFERGVSSGEIKQIAINLGAPGDQRDDRETVWLGFPRPLVTTACPAPVTVLMDRASAYHKQRAAESMTGTDAPWIYSSGISGSGRIAVALTLQPNVVMPTREVAPSLDGKLDDPCWEQAGVATFENSPFTILGASVDLRVFRDAENLYFGYRRGPLASPRADADEATLNASDELDIYLTDRRRSGKRGIRFVIGRDGETAAAFGTVDRYRKTDPSWRGEWECVTSQAPGEWTAEVAIPLATLSGSGLKVGELMLNCMSQNLTASGLEAIFLIDPAYGSDFRRCIRFRGVVDAPAEPAAERAFTVRLHFAELDGAAAGERVFDVALQGRSVVEGLDIAGEVVGNAALVKEFTGVLGSESIAVELTPKAGSALPPIISGIEIIEGVRAP